MNRRRTAILASIVFAALIMAVFATLQTGSRPVNAQQINAAPQIDLVQMEKDFTEREAVYRRQMLDLGVTLEQRRTTYEQQVATLTQALDVGRSHLEGLNAQEAAAEGQLTQFNQASSERQAIFLASRQEAQNSYDLRYSQMQAQLAEVQVKLAEAQQLLGQ